MYDIFLDSHNEVTLPFKGNTPGGDDCLYYQQLFCIVYVNVCSNVVADNICSCHSFLKVSLGFSQQRLVSVVAL